MPLTRGLSRSQRMMEAVRRHFRTYGASPSHTELAVATGIARNAVGTVLRQLAAADMIGISLGKGRSITLPDRLAMFSNAEIELAVVARGGAITWPASAVAPLLDAYRVEPGTDCSLFAMDLLAQIDAAEQKGIEDGERHERNDPQA
jgi:hypothetical protein